MSIESGFSVSCTPAECHVDKQPATYEVLDMPHDLVFGEVPGLAGLPLHSVGEVPVPRRHYIGNGKI